MSDRIEATPERLAKFIKIYGMTNQDHIVIAALAFFTPSSIAQHIDKALDNVAKVKNSTRQQVELVK